MKKRLLFAFTLMLLGGFIFSMTACSLNWDFKEIFNANFEQTSIDVTQDFRSIGVLTDTADITLLPSEDGVCRVIAKDHKKIQYTATVENETLKIRSADTRKWHERIFNLASPSLTVYLPAEEYAALSIKESTGDVTVGAPFHFESIDIQLSTGDIDLGASATDFIKLKGSTGKITVQNVNCSSLNVIVSTGNITIHELNCTGDVYLESSTGEVLLTDISCKNFTSTAGTSDFTLENLRASENASIERSTGDVNITDATSGGSLTLKTSTGKITLDRTSCEGDLGITLSSGRTYLTDVSCKNLTTVANTGDLEMTNVLADETLSIKRSTGDVTFNGCDATDIVITTDTGDVKGTLNSGKIFTVRTDTGRIDVPDNTLGGTCKITTDTGNVRIQIP